MTKTAATPIYDKIYETHFSGTADDLETRYAALVASTYQVCSNDDPWLTMTFLR